MEERARALLRVTITAKAACAAQAPVECAWRARATDVSEVQTSDPPEHIIPDAMGGTLKTDRVCRECNGRAGSDIDGPFMQDWLIAMDRGLHSPGGHRMQPRVDAALEDGTLVDMKTGKGPWKATVRASIEWNGDTVTIRASDRDEYVKLLARVRRDVEAQGKRALRG